MKLSVVPNDHKGQTAIMMMMIMITAKSGVGGKEAMAAARRIAFSEQKRAHILQNSRLYLE